jgi:phenylalanyl-tRNA synthetase beta chain
VPVAARRAAKLLAETAGGEVLAGVVEAYPAPLPPQVIELQFGEVERVLGFRPADAEIDRILTALQFDLKETLWGRTVTVPPTRLDVQAGQADLIEEIARVLGYDNLPSRLLPEELPPQAGNAGLEFDAKVQDTLAELGLTETIHYSLSGVAAETPFAAGFGEPVTLVNPVSPERAILRRTLLPGLVQSANDNLEPGRAAGVAIFELGPVFVKRAGELPDEPRRLALLMAGRRGPAAWDDPLGGVSPAFDFYDLKGVVEALLATLHLPPATFAPLTDSPHLHPGRAATVTVNGVTLSTLGELHPRVSRGFKHLAERRVALAELDLDALMKLVPPRVGYTPLSPFPPALRDLAVVVPAETPAEAVTAEVVAGGGELLESATLFDVYKGDSIPAGTKSLAYALCYRVRDRQLADKEVDKAHQRIEGRLRHTLKAGIRGKD